MSHLANRSWPGLALLFLACLQVEALGHGSLPINVFLAGNQRLVIGPEFEAGPLTLFEDAIFTDLPGVAVLSPGNLVPHGTELGLDVLSGVAFWNGRELVQANVELEIRPPLADGFGHPNSSQVDQYTVGREHDYQLGMRWGIYDGSVPGWDTHGTFALAPVSAPTGVYGIVIQVTSPDYLPTDPILVSLAYDPSGLGELSVGEYEAGVAALTEWAELAWQPLQAGDANQDYSFDESDLLAIFQSGKYRTGLPARWSDGDWNGAPAGRVGDPPSGDGLFDESDLIAAFSNGLYRAGSYIDRASPSLAVPEPHGAASLILALFCALVQFRQTLRGSHD